MNQLSASVRDYDEYCDTVQRFEEWLDVLRQTLNNRKKASNPAEVENVKEEYRHIASDIQKQQQKIIEVQMRIDDSRLNELLHPEATHLQNRLMTVRKETNVIMDAVRKHTNELSNVITEHRTVEKRLETINENVQKIFEQIPNTLSIHHTVDKASTVSVTRSFAICCVLVLLHSYATCIRCR